MTPSKIIVFRNDRFGEFLLNIPVFRALKEHYPQAKLTVVVDSYVKPLAQRVPFIDNILVWENRKHSFFEKISFIKLLRAEKAQVILILNPGKDLNFISYFSGIPVRVGYDRKSAFFLNRKVEDRKAQGLKHESEYNLDLFKELGVQQVSADFTDALRMCAEDFPYGKANSLGLEQGRFIVMHPWASNPQKEWGLENFRKLSGKLILDAGLKVVLAGSNENSAKAQELAEGLNLVNLTGETSLLELGGLLKMSRLLVTNDSGPMHLAAVLGVPTIALFRKTPPGVSARRWGPVGSVHTIIEGEAVADIQVSEVYDAVKKSLQR